MSNRQPPQDNWIWGNHRGGGGAPVKTATGEVVADLKLQKHLIDRDYKPNSPVRRSDPYANNNNYDNDGGEEDGYDDNRREPRRRPDKQRGSNGSFRRNRDEQEDDDYDLVDHSHSPERAPVGGGNNNNNNNYNNNNNVSSSVNGSPRKFMSSLREMISDPVDKEAKLRRQQDYQNELKQQIEEKKRQKEKEKQSKEEYFSDVPVVRVNNAAAGAAGRFPRGQGRGNMRSEELAEVQNQQNNRRPGDGYDGDRESNRGGDKNNKNNQRRPRGDDDRGGGRESMEEPHVERRNRNRRSVEETDDREQQHRGNRNARNSYDEERYDDELNYDNDGGPRKRPPRMDRGGSNHRNSGDDDQEDYDEDTGGGGGIAAGRHRGPHGKWISQEDYDALTSLCNKLQEEQGRLRAQVSSQERLIQELRSDDLQPGQVKGRAKSMHQLARPTGDKGGARDPAAGRPKSMRAAGVKEVRAGMVPPDGGRKKKAPREDAAPPRAAFGGGGAGSRLAPIQKIGPPVPEKNPQQQQQQQPRGGMKGSVLKDKRAVQQRNGGGPPPMQPSHSPERVGKGRVGFSSDLDASERDRGGGGGLSGFAKLQNVAKSRPIVVSYDDDGGGGEAGDGVAGAGRRSQSKGSRELTGVSEYIRNNGHDDVISGDQLDRLLLQARSVRVSDGRR